MRANTVGIPRRPISMNAGAASLDGGIRFVLAWPKDDVDQRIRPLPALRRRAVRRCGELLKQIDASGDQKAAMKFASVLITLKITSASRCWLASWSRGLDRGTSMSSATSVTGP